MDATGYHLGSVHIMAKQNLTDAKLKGIKATGTAYWLQDNSGLYVKVGAAGAIGFYTRYQLDGKRRFLYHDVQTLAGARRAHADAVDQATDARHQRDPDLDPAAKRTAASVAKARKRTAELEAPTVASFAESYLLRHAEKKKKSAAEDRRILEKDVLPFLGAVRLKELTRAAIVECLDRIDDRGALRQTWQTLKTVRRMLNFAIERGALEVNPASHIKTQQTFTAKTRHLDEDELRALFTYMKRFECGWGASVNLAIRMQLATGCRPGEIRLACWREIDEAAGTWTIPAERLKTWSTKKHPQPHVLPLTTAMLSALTQARKLSSASTGFILPGLAENQPLSEQAVGRAITRSLATGIPGIEEAFTPHDLRRTVATRLAKLGYGTTAPYVLGHTPQTVTGIHYDQHDYLPEKRLALDAWSERLDALDHGDALANVIPMRA